MTTPVPRRIASRSLLDRLRQVFAGRAPDRCYPGMIIALPDDRILFYSIPKVACSSIMATCVEALGLELPPGSWAPEVFQTHRWDHLYDRESIVSETRLPPRYRGFWSFAFVRNPWDRLVSCYTEKIRDDGDDENFVNGVSRVLLPYGVFKRGMSFAGFARAVAEIPDREAEPHFLSQHRFITAPSGALVVDFVGRFETLRADFEVVRSRIRGPTRLPHLLKSSHGAFREYYDRALIDVVGERYAEDVERFGYEP
jgi:hypothetical protein